LLVQQDVAPLLVVQEKQFILLYGYYTIHKIEYCII
jgi:hypothetical protein